jgi:hypothetical protein
MLGVVKLLERPSLGGSLFQNAMQLMQSLVMGAEARTALLRTSFLIDAQQNLQRGVNAKDLQKQVRAPIPHKWPSLPVVRLKKGQ